MFGVLFSIKARGKDMRKVFFSLSLAQCYRFQKKYFSFSTFTGEDEKLFSPLMIGKAHFPRLVLSFYQCSMTIRRHERVFNQCRGKGKIRLLDRENERLFLSLSL